MSATNRTLGLRNKADFYTTPIGHVVHFMKEWQKDEPGLFNYWEDQGSKMRVLDPCAGGDEKRPMSYPAAFEQLGLFRAASITTIDIRDDSKATLKVDYIETRIDFQEDLVISNPPFSLIQQFVEKGRNELLDSPYSRLSFLMRINYFGAQYRKDWWASHMAYRAYVFSDRPKMGLNKNGVLGSDATEYAHFIWKHPSQGQPKWTELRVI